eukprot:COSAG05_NODE_15_length_36348_cov_78.369307_11_plen_174_part_00
MFRALFSDSISVRFAAWHVQDALGTTMECVAVERPASGHREVHIIFVLFLTRLLRNWRFSPLPIACRWLRSWWWSQCWSKRWSSRMWISMASGGRWRSLGPTKVTRGLLSRSGPTRVTRWWSLILLLMSYLIRLIRLIRQRPRTRYSYTRTSQNTTYGPSQHVVTHFFGKVTR